jgi:ATP-dependent 26S proteasome regulatory subunit
MGISKEIIESIRARETLIFIETIEEEETVNLLKNVAKTLNRPIMNWDPVKNYTDISPDSVPKAIPPMDEISDLEDMLKEIRQCSSDGIYVLRDIGFYLHENQDRERLARLVRNFKELKNDLKASGSAKKNIILLGSHFNITRELQEDFSISYFKRSNADELKSIFLNFIADNDLTEYASKNEDVVEEIVNAGKGLTADQFRSCLAKSVIRERKIESNAVDLVMDVKKQIISKNGILEYIEETGDMNSVGGLTNLKSWVKKRQKGFNKEARLKGLPEPKGLLVFGVPGTGKSLSAKAVSGLWRRPIIRFDMGRIFGSFVGESEKNMRDALRMAESVAPCLLWIDELEKGFAGSSGGHETTIRVLGNFLTWMQEKKESVFVIATANDVSALPPEFLRKGRFDEMFFVNVPNTDERKEIIKIQLKKYKHDPNRFNLDELSKASNNYTGAEIEQAIIEAGYNALDEDRDVNDTDIRNAIIASTPVYSTFKDKLDNPQYKAIVKMAKQASKKDGEK